MRLNSPTSSPHLTSHFHPVHPSTGPEINLTLTSQGPVVPLQYLLPRSLSLNITLSHHLPQSHFPSTLSSALEFSLMSSGEASSNVILPLLLFRHSQSPHLPTGTIISPWLSESLQTNRSVLQADESKSKKNRHTDDPAHIHHLLSDITSTVSTDLHPQETILLVLFPPHIPLSLLMTLQLARQK